MSDIQDEPLFQFIAGYFHEDWVEDDPDWRSVVRRYIKDTNIADKQGTAAGISQLIASDLTDAQLQQTMQDKYGLYYIPEADGHGAREWLTRVVEMLNGTLKTG